MAVDDGTLDGAREIVQRVRRGGEAELREYAERFGDLDKGAPLIYSRSDLETALDRLPDDEKGLIERSADRIGEFAEQQLARLQEFEVEVGGGRAGHRVLPVGRAGCYAPGGRYPLPSTVLMTVIPAKVAGVDEVLVASPKPQPITLATAALAGADAVLGVGGAQAIAAMAYGVDPILACDVIVGPGNRWVTAAKQIVSGVAGIDMLAGPSELLVLADGGADPRLVAADLLAQAEHDTDAIVILVTDDPRLADAVDRELGRQLETLATAGIARQALNNGYAVITAGIDEAVAVCNRVGPEHLELLCAGSDSVANRLTNYGALFIGPLTAQMLGDYATGPNHVLPTGGTSRYTGGLSVMHFLRLHTWLRIDNVETAAATIEDAIRFARIEGLEAHARSAEMRLDRVTSGGASSVTK